MYLLCNQFLDILLYSNNNICESQLLAGFEDKTFVEFLKSKKVTANILHYIQHSIAMVTDNATTLEVRISKEMLPTFCSNILFISDDTLPRP